MKLKLLIALLLCSTFLSNAQSNRKLADKYLTKRGELVFTFTANNNQEIQELSRIISFDHHQDSNPLTINAIANRKGFARFLKFNLPFKVNIEENEPKEVTMFDPKIHKKGVSGKNAAYTYPLEFPLVAYPTYGQYEDQMTAFAAEHSDVVKLEIIGSTPGTTLEGGHDLFFIVLSDNIATREAEPRLMYTSSMHGNEIAGYPSMLNLIDYFIRAYKNIDENGDPLAVDHPDHVRIANLLDNSEVWINPLANPDGTYYTTNAAVSTTQRGNANNIDLNRNYPQSEGSANPDGEAYQTETLAFMALAESTHFVLSANFHGGIEVVNYPWDFTPDRHPDDTWFQLISREYADTAQFYGPPGYMDDLTDGITHGADWYQVEGGRQDYMNYEMHTKETTIELSGPSANKAPSNVLDYWNYNQEAYIEYLIQGTYGFQGIVKDASGNPIKAKITLIENGIVHDSRGSWVETELPLGDFYRPINAGTYDVLIEAIDDCYISVTLEDKLIADYTKIDLGVITLNSVIDAGPNSLIASNVTSNSATLGWSDINGASSYEINYRESGGLWNQTTSSTNSISLSSLIPDTTYEFYVNVTCNSNTSPDSAVQSFNTSTFSYCPSSGDASDRGITNVTFVGETTINNSDTDNTSGYEDFSTQSANINKSKINPTYSLSVTATSGTTGNDPLFTRAFIDFNGDGNFDDSIDSDEIINLGTILKQTTAVTSLSPVTITIPINSTVGAVRMRISSKKGSYPTACETPSFVGEVEDYTINIIDTSLGIQDELLSAFNLYPNPSDIGEIKLTVPNEIQEFSIEISNVLGQTLLYDRAIHQTNKTHTINTTKFKSGIYIITIATNLGRATKKIIIE